jgi:DNA-binding PadR family transcriptional regulator
VYPALHRLERGGLLKSTWSDQGRRRRVYSLTARGRRELSDRRTSWRDFASTMEAVLA